MTAGIGYDIAFNDRLRSSGRVAVEVLFTVPAFPPLWLCHHYRQGIQPKGVGEFLVTRGGVCQVEVKQYTGRMTTVPTVYVFYTPDREVTSHYSRGRQLPTRPAAEDERRAQDQRQRYERDHQLNPARSTDSSGRQITSLGYARDVPRIIQTRLDQAQSVAQLDADSFKTRPTLIDCCFMQREECQQTVPKCFAEIICLTSSAVKTSLYGYGDILLTLIDAGVMPLAEEFATARLRDQPSWPDRYYEVRTIAPLLDATGAPTS